MKKMLFSLILVSVFMLLFSVNAFAQEVPENDVRAFYNNEEIILPEDYGKILIDNQSRTIIPLRGISEALGLKVDWDQDTWTATIDDKVKVTIGDNKVVTPEGIVKMDTKAVLIEGRTYVPLRFILESLDGFEIDYNFTSGFHRIDIFSSVESEFEEEDNKANVEVNFKENSKAKDFEEKYGEDKVDITKGHITADKQGYKGKFASLQLFHYPLENVYSLTVDNLQGENREMFKDMLWVIDIPFELSEFLIKDWDQKGKLFEANRWNTYNDEIQYRVEERQIGAEYFFRVKK
ncbi:copper amine oxidase N-terminal domain-containing protein [Brassicibacter mesophilus]|uniref:copper amine oxidase N-terminal domain-containing protein n=1 Tax=Brassicibacter mesophilus TaxID=745119 RepID=UPI003D2602ED